ncbi:MAG: hypothetical protein EOS27_25345 [Mesorhizobium sp.]|nr:MAG: hypothetical protein EOS27_25345 [Mesorhizobium sp.]
MNHAVSGWNECLVAYVLAAGSPSSPIDAEVPQRIRRWSRISERQEALRDQTAARTRPTAGRCLWRITRFVASILVP